MPPEQLGSPKMPDTMRIQGVLYLEDTSADGGGFCCVPGFHKEFEAWVASVSEVRAPPPSKPLLVQFGRFESELRGRSAVCAELRVASICRRRRRRRRC